MPTDLDIGSSPKDRCQCRHCLWNVHLDSLSRLERDQGHRHFRSRRGGCSFRHLCSRFSDLSIAVRCRQCLWALTLEHSDMVATLECSAGRILKDRIARLTSPSSWSLCLRREDDSKTIEIKYMVRYRSRRWTCEGMLVWLVWLVSLMCG